MSAVHRGADRFPNPVDLYARDGGEAGEKALDAGGTGPDHGEVVDGPATEALEHDDLDDVGAGDAQSAGHLPECARSVRQGDSYPQQHSSPPKETAVVVHHAKLAFRPGCAAMSPRSRRTDMPRVTGA
jgi:hypothetical protein